MSGIQSNDGIEFAGTEQGYFAETYDTTAAAEKTYYATGWYGPTSEGDAAIYTGELALTPETTASTLDADTVASLRLFESVSGNQVRKFRLIDEGPLLPVEADYDNSAKDETYVLDEIGSVSPTPHAGYNVPGSGE